MSDLRRATEGCVLGFAKTKALAYPREVERVGEFWVCRDVPARKKARVVDLAGVLEEPEGYLEILEREPDERWSCWFVEPGTDKKLALPQFKEAGFRRNWMAPLYDLEVSDAFELDERVLRVRDWERAELIRLASWGKVKHVVPEDLEGGAEARRLYGVFEGDDPVGWVSSVPTGGGGSWVANLFVKEEARGRGLGRALMETMLADDRAQGIERSVLTASEDGARLYEKLGYVQVGTIHFLRPPNYRSVVAREINR